MANQDDKILSWLRLALCPGVGPIRGSRLVSGLGGVEAVFSAGRGELLRIEGMTPSLASAVQDSSTLETALREYEKCLRSGIQVVCLDDPGYPRLLREIADPPLILFLRGQYRETDEKAVAVVGTRHPDVYGESMAVSLAAGVARYGVTVVSGMARGIDSMAQAAAVKAGGRSIAVLGTGADVVYPAEQKKLYEELVEKGAVVSEFPSGTDPAPANFPRRNRIISGLSRGVVMVQAMSEKSGALSTVRHALEQGREIFAVPGNAGTRPGRVGNALIKQGARLVENAEDILADLLPLGTLATAEPASLPGILAPALPELQAKLYALVPSPAEGTVEIDALARRAGTSPAETASALLELELSGLIRALPGKRFVRLTGD